MGALVRRCCRSIRVEAALLERGGPPRQVLRVTQGPYLLAYAETVEQVAAYVDLALLEDA